jgi:SAM-dependent methyltransferase
MGRLRPRAAWYRKGSLRELSPIMNPLSSAEITKFIRFFLDECMPPIIRDQRWFYRPVQIAYNRRMDPDFKVKAPHMSDAEFAAAYEAIVPMRSTDMTARTTEFVISHIVGKSVLEVGCGNGDISIACAARGYAVCATDLAEGNLAQVRIKNPSIALQPANVEKLPFARGEFDTTLCLHTLEHVKDLRQAINELKRVTRQRLIVIVPQERYFRFSCNYHLNFVGGPEQLLLAMQIPGAKCQVIDGALCYFGDIGDAAPAAAE